MDQVLIGMGIGSLLFFLAAVYMFLDYKEHKIKLIRLLLHISRSHSVTALADAAINSIDTLLNSGSTNKVTGSESLMKSASLLKWAGRFSRLGKQLPFPHTEQELENLLDRSGVAHWFTPEMFLGLKALFAVVGLVIGCSAFAVGLPFSQFGLLLLPLVGFMAPVIWLKQVGHKRQESISAAIPDFLDVMSVTLQAGVSLDQALQQTGSIFHGPLQDEIFRIKREMELGVDRDTAWKRLLERNSAPDLRKLAKAVLQGSNLGVPVSDIFRMQADECRRLRMERAKQKAAKASPKITLVTTVVMAPAVFVMILGLVLLNVFYNPQGLGIEGLFK
jgi:tight adherence protein C